MASCDYARRQLNRLQHRSGAMIAGGLADVFPIFCPELFAGLATNVKERLFLVVKPGTDKV